MKRIVIFLSVVGMVSAFVLYGLLSSNPSNDVLLYVQCQDIRVGRLRITLLDADKQPFHEQDFQLASACDQAGIPIVKDAHIRWLNVVLQLYSADGKLLSSQTGSRQQNDILLDENGFHVDLKLHGEPPRIAFHTL